MRIQLCCLVVASLAGLSSPDAARAGHRGLVSEFGFPAGPAARGGWPVARLRGGEVAGETEYERERREKLAKNLAMMRSLGLSVGGGEIQKKVAARKRTRRKRLQPNPDQPVRRSARNITKVKYVESSEEEDRKKKAESKDSEFESSLASPDSAEDSDEDFGGSDPGSEEEADTPQKPRGRPAGWGRAKGRAPEEVFGCPSWAPADKVRGVWERLKEARSAIAERQNVKAYKIAHDRSLWEIAVNVPSRPVDLLRCWGMGMQKVEKYGQELADVIKACNATWTRPRSTLDQFTIPGSVPPSPQRLFPAPQLSRAARRVIYNMPPERPRPPVGSLFINGSWVYPKSSAPLQYPGALPFSSTRPVHSPAQRTMWFNGSVMPVLPSPTAPFHAYPPATSHMPGPAWLRNPTAPYTPQTAAPIAAPNPGLPSSAPGIASSSHLTARQNATPSLPPSPFAAAGAHPMARGIEVPASHTSMHAVVPTAHPAGEGVPPLPAGASGGPV